MKRECRPGVIYRFQFFIVNMNNREKFYGCKSPEYAEVKIVEEWFAPKNDVVCSYKYTAYFGDCDRGFYCFRNWWNYIDASVELRLYLKVEGEWEGVVYKHINKDKVDDTEDVLKIASELLGRDINNWDMFV